MCKDYFVGLTKMKTSKQNYEEGQKICLSLKCLPESDENSVVLASGSSVHCGASKVELV